MNRLNDEKNFSFDIDFKSLTATWLLKVNQKFYGTSFESGLLILQSPFVIHNIGLSEFVRCFYDWFHIYLAFRKGIVQF